MVVIAKFRMMVIVATKAPFSVPNAMSRVLTTMKIAFTVKGSHLNLVRAKRASDTRTIETDCSAFLAETSAAGWFPSWRVKRMMPVARRTQRAATMARIIFVA